MTCLLLTVLPVSSHAIYSHATSIIAAESHTQKDGEMAISIIAAESHAQNDGEVATSIIAAESHTQNDDEMGSNISSDLSSAHGFARQLARYLLARNI